MSAAVSAGLADIEVAYEIEEISNSLDYINLMSYVNTTKTSHRIFDQAWLSLSFSTYIKDMHGAWDGVLGFNAPLFERADETGFSKTQNVDYIVQYLPICRFYLLSFWFKST